MLPYTRRDFAKLAFGALPAAAALTSLNRLGAAERSRKPNSKVRGVQIGLNVPYSFGNPAMSGDDVLAACVKLGVSGLELRTQPVEAFLGARSDLVNSKNSVRKGAAADAALKELREWRLSAPVARVAEFRRKYEDAGVKIEIVKVDNIFKMVDAELDYVFGVAKALGARAISTEIAHNDDDLKRLGSFADKHRFMVGYHGHTKTGPADWEKAFSFAKYNGANVDLGHFVAGNNTSPVEFIKQHHARITHVHVKDKKMHEGPNTLFGEGDTPIVEVLRLIRDNHWNMQATIEFEYKVPAGSDRMTEIAKCVKYCRDALA